MKIFDKAILKMTVIYTAILLLLSLIFSSSIYSITANEMNRVRAFRPRPEIQVFERDISGFEVVIRERNAEVLGSLLTQLIVVNISVVVIGAIASYFLARLTVKPIHEAYEKQSRFVSDASHELRTPLTAIAMENEVLLREKSASKDDYKKAVESNLDEVKKLQSLTNYLLQLDNDKEPKNKEAALKQITNILVENAIKYDPEHRQPKIVRSKHQIDVVDKGAGIAEEDLPYIFERFYRGEKSRTSEGYGLGLSLAQKLAEQIGAKIEAKNNETGGATFSVILQKDSVNLETIKKG
jgi:signal transduction histidine kinase